MKRQTRKKSSKRKFMCHSNTLSRPLDQYGKGDKPWKMLVKLSICAHARSTSNVALWYPLGSRKRPELGGRPAAL